MGEAGQHALQVVIGQRPSVVIGTSPVNQTAEICR